MPAAKPKRQIAKSIERTNLEVLSTPNALDRVDREIISLLQRDAAAPTAPSPTRSDSLKPRCAGASSACVTRE